MGKKFTARIDFNHGGIQYEAGNTHSKHQHTDDEVLEFHKNGWASIDGLADVETDTSPKKLEIQNGVIGHQSTDLGEVK